MRFSDMAFTRALARSAGVSSDEESGVTLARTEVDAEADEAVFGAFEGELGELLEVTCGRRRGTGLCVGLG